MIQFLFFIFEHKGGKVSGTMGVPDPLWNVRFEPAVHIVHITRIYVLHFASFDNYPHV